MSWSTGSSRARYCRRRMRKRCSRRPSYFKLPNDYRVASAAFTNGVPVAEFDPGSKLGAAFSQWPESSVERRLGTQTALKDQWHRKPSR